MIARKRKREIVDDTEKVDGAEGDGSSPIGKKEKLSYGYLESAEPSLNDGLTNVVKPQSNGEATHSKKKVRLGQKLRKQAKANKQTNQDVIPTKPLSKGEQLRSLIKQRKLEVGVRTPDSKTKDLDKPEKDVDENYLQLSEKSSENVEKLNDDDDTDSHEEGSAESAPLPPFNAKSFRKSLKGKDRMSAFRTFVKLLFKSHDTDVATEYMSSGGSALEILQVLDSSDRDNFGHANPVFNALHKIIMRSLTDSPAFKPSCEEGCRHLLNAYLPTIQRMLSEKGSNRERKTVLQLLTGVVSMSPVFARDILVNLNFPMPILKLLTLTIKTGDKQNVRMYFIHYLMAYLVDNDVTLIRPLLDKQGLLNSIVFGLPHDSAETVHLVLTTLRTSVVENRSITKTHKIHVFNTSIIKALVRLYEWRGPRTVRKSRHAKDVSDADQPVDAEAKAMVTDALDCLLTVLCTNHKLGVVFVDRTLGTSGQRLNELMWSVLKELQRPWETPQVRDLVVRILAACPDLVKARMVEVEGFIEPRVSAGWIQTVEYAKQVIEAMDPERILAPYVHQLTSNQLEAVVQTLCAPLPVLRAVGRATLLHDNLIVRHTALTLLCTMMRQARRFFAALDRWALFGADGITTRDRFRFKISKHFPSVAVLLEAWDMAVTPITATESLSFAAPPSVTVHVSVLLDLLLLYHSISPSKFKTAVCDTLALKKLLADVKRLASESERETEVMETTREGDAVDAIQVKAVQLVLAVDSTAFKDDKEIFSETFHLLLQMFHQPTPAVSMSAYSVLSSIMNSTGLFTRSPGEIDLWLHCYRTLPTEQQDSAGQLFVRSLNKVMRKPEKYVAAISEAEGKAKEEAKGNVKVTDKVVTEGSELKDMGTYLSPLLPCILSTVEESDIKQIKNFLNFAVVHLLHGQTYPSTIVHLVKESLLDLKVSQYIHSWLDKKTKNLPLPLGALFGADSVEHNLSAWILSNIDVTANDSCVKLEAELEETAESKPTIPVAKHIIGDELVDTIHVSLLFNLTMFHLTRLMARNQLTEKSRSKCADTLKMFLEKQKTLSIDSTELGESSADLCLRNLFKHPELLKSFAPFHLNNKTMTHSVATVLVVDLVRWSTAQFQGESCRTLLEPYREKLVGHIVNDLKTSRKKDYKDHKDLLDIVGVFELGFKDMCVILKEAISYPVEILREKPNSLSSWGLLLGYFLRRLTVLRKEDRMQCGPLPSEVISSLAEFIAKLLTNTELDITVLLESFLSYLQQFQHNLADIPTVLFLNVMKVPDPSETAIKLGSFLLSRHCKNTKALFIDLASRSKEVMERSQIVFPFLSVLNEMEDSVPDKFLQAVYDCHQTNIILGIRKPKKAEPWLTSNVCLITRMIEKCMSFETCTELCASVQAKHSTCKEFHIRLVESVFLRLYKNHTDGVNPIVTLTNILLNLLTQTAGKDKSNMDFLCILICKYVEKDSEMSTWESVKSSPDWIPFTMQALKLGLQTTQTEYNSALLLKTLESLCQVLYKNKGKDEEIATLFQMTMSHSEFLNVMLGSTPAKLELLKLLTTLISKNPTVMASSHIPVLLGSYNATLSRVDQLVLKLLKTYETNNVSLHECRPYLWGEAAVNYFCVRSKETQSLWRQPHMGQVVDLLKKEMVEETITKFPLDRKLNLDEHEDKPNLYDPAFLLPLFSHLLASESFVKCYKFTHTGGLALTLSSLASTSMSVRAAAYHVLSRFHGHVDASRGSHDKKWWLQFLDAIRNGVVELGEEGTAPQVACVVTTFLARASVLISQPLDPMFTPLNRFILAKPAINLDAIPELYLLFHSTEQDSRLYRRWLLEVIRDGLRLKQDLQLCLSVVLFKLLLVFYSSVIATQDKRSKVMILQIINSAVKLPGVAQLLISGYGLLPWLHQSVRQLTSSDNDLISATIQLLNSLWKALSNTNQTKIVQSQSVNSTSCNLNIMLLLVALLPVLPSSMSAVELKKYLTVLKDAAVTCKVLTADHLLSLVRFSKRVLGPVDDCEDLLEFGCTHAAKGRVSDVSSSNDVEAAHSCLRQLIISVSSSHHASVGVKVVKKNGKKNARNTKIFKEKMRIQKANKVKQTLLKVNGKNVKKTVKVVKPMKIRSPVIKLAD